MGPHGKRDYLEVPRARRGKGLCGTRSWAALQTQVPIRFGSERWRIFLSQQAHCAHNRLAQSREMMLNRPETDVIPPRLPRSSRAARGRNSSSTEEVMPLRCLMGSKIHPEARRTAGNPAGKRNPRWVGGARVGVVRYCEFGGISR